jgi:hypothetical protein
MLACKKMIVGGDLNFTVSAREVWGDSKKLDPMFGFFKGFFQGNHLVDIIPIEVVTTWKNGRIR